MWTVLIVEDEVFVRESIIEIIKWEQLGFTVIGEAGNGLDALALMKQFHPDLVITDIMMPVMDGIELIKQARELGLDSRFVILSCMGEFEYVRQAMEYGASNYILKLSMNVKALRDTLEKINVELMTKYKRAEEEIEQYYGAIWKTLFEQELDRSAKSISMTMPSKGFEALQVKIITVLHGEAPFTKEILLKQEWLAPEQLIHLHLFTRYGVTSVFCWYEPNGELPLSIPDECPYAVAYSTGMRLGQIPEMWGSTIHALNSAWYQVPQEREHTMSAEQPVLTHYIPGLETQLYLCFEQGKWESCQKLIQRMWDSMCENRWPLPLVKRLANRMDQTIAGMTKSSVFQYSLHDAVTHEELRVRLVEKVEHYLKEQMKTMDNWTDHPEINKILLYIRQHYDQNITLRFMAKYIAMDENYVSTLFKRKTGENLIAYLQRFRIEQATIFLRETDLSVSDIGQKVGFENDNYFIKIFRRFANMTPNAYRKQQTNN